MLNSCDKFKKCQEHIISEYNKYIKNAVIKKYCDLKQECSKKEPVIKRLDIIKGSVSEETEKSLLESNENYINYYWIDYCCNTEGEVNRRVTFFYKDFDLNSLNVHVIPGVIQEWVRIDKDGIKQYDIPVLQKESGRLFMNNILKRKGYFPFIEEVADNEFWAPLHRENNAIMYSCDTIVEKEVFANLRECFDCTLKKLGTILKNEIATKFVPKDFSVYRNTLYYGRAPKYTGIRWLFLVTENECMKKEYHTLNFFDIRYFNHIGLITLYNNFSVTKAQIFHKGNEIKVQNRINEISKENHKTAELRYRINEPITDVSGKEDNPSILSPENVISFLEGYFSK